MWPARTRDEPELLSLFEASGRNVEQAAGLLQELLAAYPDRPELAEARPGVIGTATGEGKGHPGRPSRPREAHERIVRPTRRSKKPLINAD